MDNIRIEKWLWAACSKTPGLWPLTRWVKAQAAYDTLKAQNDMSVIDAWIVGLGD
jgi:hypothetical protein